MRTEMLKSLSFTNYKAFADQTTIRLAPITLLYGENHAGKSAIARFPIWLSDSIAGRTRAAFKLDAPVLRGAGFQDILCKQSESQTLQLGLEWDDLTFSASYRDVGNRVRATNFEFASPHEGANMQWKLGTENDYEDSSGSTHAIEFEGPLPAGDSGALERLANEARVLASDVLWLEANRISVPREEPAPKVMPATLGSKGERAVAACVEDDSLRRLTSTWYEQHFSLEFSITRVANHVRPGLGRLSSPHIVDLPDCGEGFSQILPVVVAVSQARLRRGPRILCFEHPELHLHPDAQSAVADLFKEAVEEPTIRILTETHSENLLLGLLLMVAKGELSRESLAVYRVRQRSDGTSVADEIEIDGLGRLGPQFPPGTFRQDTRLSRQLVEARRRKL